MKVINSLFFSSNTEVTQTFIMKDRKFLFFYQNFFLKIFVLGLKKKNGSDK